MEANKDFAELAFMYRRELCKFDDNILEITGWDDYGNFGFDCYDMSIEIYEVPNDYILSEEAQKFIYDSGFLRCYVNHLDGWETHYVWRSEEFHPVEGWRVKYPSKNSDISVIQVEKPIPDWNGFISHEVVKKN